MQYDFPFSLKCMAALTLIGLTACSADVDPNGGLASSSSSSSSSSSGSSSSSSSSSGYGKLNDTGSVCLSSCLPGDDGLSGRDALAKASQLIKKGGGEAGFDFSKLNQAGQVVPIQQQTWQEKGTEAEGTQWSCIQDNHTGLTWEIKSADSKHARYKGHTYSWYNTLASINGGDPGVRSAGQCLGSDCDTSAYVKLINQQKLCGFNDWRLPNTKELISLRSEDHKENLRKIDTQYFPDVSNDEDILTSRYWSTVTDGESPNKAWFNAYGSVSYNVLGVANKGSAYKIRLVRGGPAPVKPTISSTNRLTCNVTMASQTPNNQFIIHNNGTVTDTTTNLMWQRCALPSIWNGNSQTCIAGPRDFDLGWPNAVKKSTASTIGSFTNWRLANLKEMESITEHRCWSPSLNTTIFPGNLSSNLWTSTLLRSETNAVWTFDSTSGSAIGLNMAEEFSFFLVRDVE